MDCNSRGFQEFWPDNGDSSEPPEAALSEVFRDAMRRFAASVTIISTQAAGEYFGMTATAVTSISMDPPSLLVGINQSASIHDPIRRTQAFCVNLLDASHVEQSAVFSGRKSGTARFADGRWQERLGMPYLTDAQACVFCQVEREITYGTHTVFFGRVKAATVAGDVSPLIYLDGSYLPFEEMPG